MYDNRFVILIIFYNSFVLYGRQFRMGFYEEACYELQQ